MISHKIIYHRPPTRPQPNRTISKKAPYIRTQKPKELMDQYNTHNFAVNHYYTPQKNKRLHSITLYSTSLILHCHPPAPWSSNGREAPRHHPSSLPLIFFAVLTKRSSGISYPVWRSANMKLRSRQYSGRPVSSSMASGMGWNTPQAVEPPQTLAVVSCISFSVKLSGRPRGRARS